MTPRGPIQVIFTVDTFTRATLGGGLLRRRYWIDVFTHA